MNPVKRQQKLEECRRAGQAGDTATAERICQTLLRANRADAQALHLLGVIAATRHDYAAAETHFGRCAAIDPRNAQFHNDLARVQALSGRYDRAVAGLERSVQLQPGNRRAITDLADVLERSGDPERAWQLLAPQVQAGAVDEDIGLVAARLLDRRGQTGQAIDMARRALATPARDQTARRQLLQLLGRLLERSGEHAQAFEAFTQAKQTEHHRFDPDQHQRDIDALIQVFSAESLARLPRAATRAETPVFIACMPRSGSTLVEQIIHAHPQAHGGGENPLLHQALVDLPARHGGAMPYPHGLALLDAAAVDALSAQLLQALRAPAPTAARVTNKHLLNYLHLGAISLLYPGARVIHVRRDRLDNGLACYMTSLSTVLMPWATDLRHIGLAWRQYERLMAHWRRTLDIQLLEVDYEALVDDTEAQTRRIVDFCGLPWDDRCLRYWEAERVVLTPSYDQVRRPIFRTALHRWRHYEAFLGPLRDALG